MSFWRDDMMYRIVEVFIKSCALARFRWSGSSIFFIRSTNSGLSDLTRSEGMWPFLSWCHKSPLLGRSKSVASSRIVIPRLNMSAAQVIFMQFWRISGARYFGSPSMTSFRSFFVFFFLLLFLFSLLIIRISVHLNYLLEVNHETKVAKFTMAFKWNEYIFGFNIHVDQVPLV